MTALMYNSENNELLSLELGLWFEDKDDSCARYYTKMDSAIGEFIVEDTFEEIYKASKRRGYVKIGEL